MRLFFACILLTNLFIGSFNADAQKLKTFKNISWLAGRWESEGKKGNIYEEWKLVSDQLMEGKSFKVFKKDTTLLENMRLIMEGTEVFYISEAKQWNNGEPVCYKMTDGNAKHMDFKNVEQTDPAIKNYQWKQNNRFNIELYALNKGKLKVHLLEFKKMKK